MNPIQKAIDTIKFHIPPQILQTFFVRRNIFDRHQNVNIDEHIISLVLRPRVLMDCSLVGGAEINVDMKGIVGDMVDNITVVFRIPKERTQGRSIMSVLSLSYIDANSLMNWGPIAPGCGVTLPGTAHQALLNSVTPPPITATAETRLIGDNVIEVRDGLRHTSYGTMRCVIANDENMSHLQPRSYLDFAKLCLLAVKAYIYNQYIIELDMGELHGGANIGVFKNVIEGYADANELYEEFLKTKFTKIQKMNDREAISRHVRSMIGGYR